MTGVKYGYSYCKQNIIHMSLICGHCGKYLGNYDVIDDMEINDIEKWIYCPYCGCELDYVRETGKLL